MQHHARIVLTAVLMIAPAIAMAQSVVSDAEQGRELAAKLCSSCHAVDAAGSPTMRADVPSFAAIANMPGTSPERLAAAIILPHPEMPGVSLTRTEIRAIIAYVLQLKKAQ